MHPSRMQIQQMPAAGEPGLEDVAREMTLTGRADRHRLATLIRRRSLIAVMEGHYVGRRFLTDGRTEQSFRRRAQLSRIYAVGDTRPTSAVVVGQSAVAVHGCAKPLDDLAVEFATTPGNRARPVELEEIDVPGIGVVEPVIVSNPKRRIPREWVMEIAGIRVLTLDGVIAWVCSTASEADALRQGARHLAEAGGLNALLLPEQYVRVRIVRERIIQTLLSDDCNWRTRRRAAELVDVLDAEAGVLPHAQPAARAAITRADRVPHGIVWH